MIDFIRLLELVYIEGFDCYISSNDEAIKFVWRGPHPGTDQIIGFSRMVNKKMLTYANEPEDVINHMVECARAGLEKMQ